MTDVVDADELLRRIRRGRDRAAGARAYEAVLRVLDEIVRPGARPVEQPVTPAVEHPVEEDGVRRVT
ncbi:hypothetical protein GTY81_29465 [Streptomyces sp. SID8366]|uniref:hypothetical protein n=1 Tax=unclassified Streptomyces TaxID=2593676 RepID=UPI000DB93464|nr:MULTISPECIES: hypothetical protein [unclassified Streptomyces]MYU07924.1 hypothetical protein [Streptomyces sp. SID8366]MYU63366.1 hypothetical protein [Streptomyces sp. SID69]RAJ59116.1 hypothetical protein K376_02877 [Streptomyces sp. PsTaAH-130]